MSLAQTPTQLLVVGAVALAGILLFVVIVAAILLRTARLEGKLEVLMTALSVEYEEEVRHVGPLPVMTDYRVKARLSDRELQGFGLEATPSQRLRPSHGPGQRPPLHPYAARPEGRTPPYGDSWPQGHGRAAVTSRPLRDAGPNSAPLGYGTVAPIARPSHGPNSRGLYQPGGQR